MVVKSRLAVFTGCILAFSIGVPWLAFAQDAPAAGEAPNVGAANPFALPGNEAQAPAPGGPGETRTQAQNPQPTTPGVPGIGNGTQADRFFFGGNAALEEVFNSNAFGVAGNNESDFGTEARLNLNVHELTRRLQADLNYSLTGDYHPQHGDLNTFYNYLNANVNAAIVPEMLLLNAKAFAWPTFLNRLGALSTSPGNASTLNNRDTYGYSATPELLTRFGDFMQSDLSATESGVFFTTPSGAATGPILPFSTPLNSQSTTVTEQLKSLTFFNRLQWILLASETQVAEDPFSQTQQLASAEIDYRFTRSFTLLTNGGYEKYKSDPSLISNLDGLFGLAGFRFAPDQSFMLSVEAGRQYNFPTYIGNLQYQITATSALIASATDTVTTPQQRLLGNLNNIGVTPGGAFYQADQQLPDQNLLTGLPTGIGQLINPSPMDSLSLDNYVSRYRVGNISLVHRMPLTTYTATVYGTIRDYLTTVFPDVDRRQTVLGGDLNVTHTLSRALTISGSLDYSNAHEFGGVDSLYTFTGLANYVITPQWSAYLRAAYLLRNANEPSGFGNGTLTDVQVAIGIQRNF